MVSTDFVGDSNTLRGSNNGRPAIISNFKTLL